MAPVTEKVESKTISPSGKEVVDPLKQVVIITDHKIRNLEKRKRKVEIYKENQQKGQTLNADQLSAVAKYTEVLKSLELAQELRKQFDGIVTETAKQQKQLAKKEAAERAARDLAVVRAVLTLQDVLTNMGVEEVREDFLAGRNGAVQITEEELALLDGIYDEVFPKREEGAPAFAEQVARASEHLLALHDGRAKEVVGTTYKALKELMGRIAACGYLDQLKEPAAADDLDGALDVAQIEADVAYIEADVAYIEIGSGDTAGHDVKQATSLQGDNKYASNEVNGI